MAASTTVFFDVDGVLNAQSGQPPRHDTGWNGKWTTDRIAETAVTWSAELVTSINLATALPNVNPVWLTSWEDEAPQFLCPAIGLNGANWPVLHGVAGDASFAWWKLDAIREHIDLHRPDQVIWIDDEIAGDRHAPAWVATAPVPILAISPQARLGLTRKHLERVYVFVSGS
jgi:hypothetical protein